MKWYKVPGYQVEVTKYGDVRDSVTKKIKNQYNDKDGYKLIAIKINEKWNTRRVHRLVAKVFCEGYKPGLEVNHKDLDKSNNYYKNLEWCTTSENAIHAIKNGVKWGNRISHKKGENHPLAKLTTKQVTKIRKLWVAKKYSQVKLARKFNVSRFVIWAIIHNKIWK